MDKKLMATRSSLIRQLKELGNEKAWREFFELYWPLLFNAALRTGFKEQDAEDLVLETVAVVAKRIDEFEYEKKKGRFKSWLLTILKHRIGDLIRKRRRRPVADAGAVLEDLPDPRGPELEEKWDQEFRAHLIGMALGRVKQMVSPDQYQMFYLYTIEGQSAAEVAAFTGTTRNAVYMAARRARKIFDEELKCLKGKPI
tara:strand:- start:260 stop:856 length:597 start_codon:yes stop_codon:yes gene_type:complete